MSYEKGYTVCGRTHFLHKDMRCFIGVEEDGQHSGFCLCADKEFVEDNWVCFWGDDAISIHPEQDTNNEQPSEQIEAPNDIA